MKNKIFNLFIYIFLFIAFLGLSCYRISTDSILLNNITTMLRILSYVGLIFYFGHIFNLSDNKEGFILKIVKLYIVFLVITTLINIVDFNDAGLFKKVSFISLLSPLIKTTSTMNFGCLLLPIYILVSSILIYIIEKIKLLSNKKNTIIVFTLLIFASIVYGFLCYRFDYFISDDRFLNIFNPINILIIFLTGFCNERIKTKLSSIKKYVIPIVLISFIGLILYYINDYVFCLRYRTYLSIFIILIILTLAFFKINHVNNAEGKIFFSIILVQIVAYYIFNINTRISLKLLLYSLVIVLSIIFVLKYKPIKLSFKFNRMYLLYSILVILSVFCLYKIGKYGMKALDTLSKNGVKDVTKYLDPIVKNAEKTLGTSQTYSYLYVDDYKRSGFLSNSRFRYRTVPNEMVNFNMVSRVFNYGTDEELNEFLCNIKADYIIIRKSDRVEEIMQVSVPKEGLIYKKNNEFCSQDLRDYFIEIREETK